MSKLTELEQLVIMEYPEGELLKNTQDNSKGCGNECKKCEICFYREEQWEEEELA